MTKAELLALTPADFDFQACTIRINKSYQRLGGKDIITDPKTAKSNRMITMPEFLSEELESYIGMLYGLNENDRIFQISKSYLHHEMDRGVKLSGVKRIRIHDLRHSHVSLLINMGYSAVAIGERVGHESVEITYRYAHLFPTMKSMGAAKNEANNAAQSAPVEKTVEKAIAEVKETYDFSNVEVEPLFKDMVDFDTFSKSDFRAVKVKECEAVPKSKKLLKFVLDDGSGVDRVILSGIHDYYEPEFLVGKTLLAITNLPPRKMMGIDSCGMIISATHLVEGREGLNVLILDDKIPAGAKLY